MKSMEEISWWHQVPLRDGRVTPGQTPVHQMESLYLFDEIDFRGKSVMDIGCWDGYFSFMAEQRGATRVLALDDPSFRWGGLDGFHFLHEHFQSKVEWRKGTIYQLPEEEFDIVLCYGVLYHLSDPLAAMMNCFQRTRERIAFEGIIIEQDLPLLRLLDPGFEGDPSNVYAISSGYMETVARQNGFLATKKLRSPVNDYRQSMLFERKERSKSPYLPRCFPTG